MLTTRFAMWGLKNELKKQRSFSTNDEAEKFFNFYDESRGFATTYYRFANAFQYSPLQTPFAQLLIEAVDKYMSEGRRTQVVLLDDRKLDIVVQPRLYVDELLNIVASHCQLKDPDKQYFGLAYADERNHYHWLLRERRVLDHEFPRKSVSTGATLVLFHLVKFYVNTVSHLAHTCTIELYFLQARQAFLRGLLLVTDQEFCYLVAQLLQICHGHYDSDEVSRIHLRQLNGMQTGFAKRMGLQLVDSEERIIQIHKDLSGSSKGASILSFLECTERSPTYGMHFYEVTDKSGNSWCLGINSKGIFQFDLNDRTRPKKVFYWKHLENLYYRDKKFSIEIHDSKRVVHTLSSFNMYEDVAREDIDLTDDLASAVCDPTTQVSVSRRAFVPSSVRVYAFLCESAQLCKTLWSSAIAQHQFYLDSRTIVKKVSCLSDQANKEELIIRLNRSLQSSSSLASAFSSPQSFKDMSIDALSTGSSLSLPSVRSTDNIEEEKKRDLNLYRSMKLSKETLEKGLIEKLKELKAICIQEGEITGELPKEIKRALAPGEAEPKIQRRVGTSFAIPQDVVSKHVKCDHIARLEADVEIQRKIVAAALRLASDRSTNKSVRRKRQKDHHQAHQRMRELEQRLHQLRLSASKPDLYNSNVAQTDDKAWPNFYGFPQSCPPTPVKFTAKSAPTTPRGSIPDLRSLNDAEEARGYRPLPPTPPNKPNLPICHKLVNDIQQQSRFLNDSPGSLPTSPDSQCTDLDDPLRMGSCGSLPIYENVGYKSASAYQSSYRTQNFPTLTSGNSTNQLTGDESDSTPISALPGTRLTVSHRTYSEHSLQSVPSLQNVDELQPLPDYRIAGSNALDHNIGAYNIPHQRTSWNYQSIEQGLNNAPSEEILPLPKYGAGRVGALVRKLSIDTAPNSNGTNYFTGSLDRRLIKNRQKLRQQQRYQMANGRESLSPVPPSPGHPIALSIQTLENSPIRKMSAPAISPRGRPPIPPIVTTPSPLSVRTNGSSIELTKPFETSDVLKYNSRIRAQSLGQSSPSHSTSSLGSNSNSIRPVSPLVTGSPCSPTHLPPSGRRQNTPRKPPPPYQSPVHNGNIGFTMGDNDSEFKKDLLAWYKDTPVEHQQKVKKATIV